MLISFDQDRPSDSPFIERVWSCHSERSGSFRSVASAHCELVFTRLNGSVFVTLRGPETIARQVLCPADGEWLAIRFSAGTFIRSLPAARLLNGNDVNLPAERRAFGLHHAVWAHPTFENAEAFVERLARAGLIVRDPVVSEVIAGDEQALSSRSVQRRFLAACGMSYASLRQIERARRATRLLRDGASISDAQFATGYYDQAHLTRSLKRYVGLTPAQVSRGEQQLSFLYKK